MYRKSKMLCYAAYGLVIRSELPLPELLAAEGAADAEVRLGKVPWAPPLIEDRGGTLWATPDEARISYQRLGSVLVRGGSQIVVEPEAGSDEGALRLLVLGPALAMLLHQRGLLVLHANAVSLNGGAIAFLGRAGQGKSTLAEALYRKSYSIVSDDVTAVRVQDGAAAVYPGFPRLKLWPEVLSSMGDLQPELPRLRPWLEKLDRRAERGFSCEPLPLERVYVLSEGERQEVETIGPKEAFMELVRNSYPPVANLLEATGTAPQHFHQCAELSRSVPIRRLKSRRSLSALPEMVRLLEEDSACSLA